MSCAPGGEVIYNNVGMDRGMVCIDSNMAVQYVAGPYDIGPCGRKM